MIEIVSRVLFSIFCAFVGTMLPVIPVWGSMKIVNPFWDIFYGLGLFVGGFLPGGLRSTPSLIFGVVIWLPLATAAVFWLSGVVLHMKSGTARNVAVLCVALTFVINVDRALIQRPPYYKLPFFTNFLGVIH